MSSESEMDEADRAWLATLVPEACVPQGFLAVAAWLDENGEQRWRCYNQLDANLSGCLGLLELAKFDLIARTPGTWFGEVDES